MGHDADEIDLQEHTGEGDEGDEVQNPGGAHDAGAVLFENRLKLFCVKNLPSHVQTQKGVEEIVEGDVDGDSVEKRNEVEHDRQQKDPYRFEDYFGHEPDILQHADAPFDGDMGVVASMDLLDHRRGEEPHDDGGGGCGEQDGQKRAENGQKRAEDDLENETSRHRRDPRMLLHKLSDGGIVDGVGVLGELREDIEQFAPRPPKESAKEDEGDEEGSEGERQEFLRQKVL